MKGEKKLTGSLQLKNGKYYAVLNLKIDGKRKQKWIDTTLTSKSGKKEREKKLREILQEYEGLADIPTCNTYFSDYIKVWLAEAKIKVDEVTYQHYENDANNHIIPYFKSKKTKLINVNRQVLQNYFLSLIHI